MPSEGKLPQVYLSVGTRTFLLAVPGHARASRSRSSQLVLRGKLYDWRGDIREQSIFVLHYLLWVMYYFIGFGIAYYISLMK
jgi:hypothetical protein